MGRRVTNGVVGASGQIGQLSVTSNTLTTTQTNTNLIIDPQGTGTTRIVGNVELNGNSTTGGEVRLMDADSSNYVSLRAASTVGTNRTLTFPDSVGSNGQVLQTDGSGVLSWANQTTAGISFSDVGTTNQTYYLTMLTSSGSLPANGSQLTSIGGTTTISFNPNSGLLTTAIGQHGTLRGSSSASGQLTILSTSNGTKATAGILMTENISSSSVSTGTLVVTGGIGVGGQLTAATLVETSSIAFKENIEPISNALEKVLNLTGVIYDRKNTDIKGEAGLIAEHVEKIIPNIVTKDNEGNTYGIQYTKLVAYLIEAVKELKAEINVLRAG